MRDRPRVPIARAMLAVSVLALDFALIRGDLSPGRHQPAWLAVTLVPSGSLLAIAATCVLRGLWRRREAGTFAFGYLVFGAAAWSLSWRHFARYDSYEQYMLLVSRVLTPILRPERWEPGGLLSRVVYLIVVPAALLVPQALCALLGGLLTSRFGLTLIARGPGG